MRVLLDTNCIVVVMTATVKDERKPTILDMDKHGYE